MNTLVIAEHDGHSLHPATLVTVSAARQLKLPIHVLVLGHDCQAVIERCRTIEGVSQVLAVNSPAFTHVLAENITPIVVEMAAGYDAILAPATTFGKNILPRIAACLDMNQVSDVTDIIDNTTFKHPIYAGNAIETVRVLDAKKLLTIRTTAFEALKATQAPCECVSIDKHVSDDRCAFVSEIKAKSERPELGAADIIVSGGRGLQSAEKFKLVEELADVLGAAVGASRAAVDAGFVPNDYQVGQTGKVVAPNLYIALGISGAIQHLAGMKDSKVIVAINKDEEAPIFQIATYGLVGDVFELVPQLIAKLKQR